MSRLRAILLINPVIVLDTIVMGTLSLAASLFDRSGNAQHRVARLWARMILWVSGVRVTVEGLEKLDPRAGYVLVSNHLSLMDIPVILACLPLQFRFFAKQELFGIPFLGWHLRRAGHLPVVRGDARQSLRVLHESARLMQQRPVSTLLFPEGGRVPTGEPPREFKEGAAHLALRAGRPAVPIGLAGTREVLPMGSLMVQPGRVRLRIGDPIRTAGLRPADRVRLNRELQQRVAELTGALIPSPPAGR